MNTKKSLVQGTLFSELDDVAVSSSAEVKKTPAQKKRQTIEELKEEILKLKKENSEKQMEIDRLKKEQEKLAFKAEAYDDLIESNSLFPIGIIAKSFGYTAQWLNEYLRQNGIQFKRDGVWELYAKYAKKGYARACWYNYSVDSYGRPLQRAHLYWTAKGLVFIRELLKADGLLKD